MAETKTIKLAEPIQVGGKEVTEVTLRRATVGDEEDAMQQAVQLKRGKNPLTVELCMISRVSKLPYDAVRSLRGVDYAAIRDAHNALNGFKREEETAEEAVEGADGENPTTPETA